MSVSTVHYTHGIVLPSATFLGALSDCTPQNQLDYLVGYASGHATPLFTGIRRARPAVEFTCAQIATALGETGLTGASQAAGNTDLYLKKATDLGNREADASLAHIRLRMSLAYLYWSQINARQGQDAEIRLRCVPTWDGTNAPIVAAGSLALAGTAAASEFFTLGPVKVNGSFLTGIQSMSLDLGFEPQEAAGDGDVFTSFFGLKAINPVLTLETLDASAWTSYGVGGLALSAILIYLRKKEPDQGNYSDASTQHIKLTGTNGLVAIEQSAGAANNEHVTTVRIALRPVNSAAAALTIATGQAIA